MLTTLRRFVKLFVAMLPQWGLRSILDAWRILTGILNCRTQYYPLDSKMTIQDSCQFVSLDDNDLPGTVVLCTSKVPSTLSGPILQYTLIDVDQPTPCNSEQDEEEAEPLSLKKTTPCMSLRYRRTIK